MPAKSDMASAFSPQRAALLVLLVERREHDVDGMSGQEIKNIF